MINRSYVSITNSLIFVSSLAFISSYLFPDVKSFFSLAHYLSDNYHTYQNFTHIFIHANFIHLLFNIVVLYSFGRLLEGVLGAPRFLIFFLVAGICGGLLQGVAGYIESKFLLDALEVKGVNVDLRQIQQGMYLQSEPLTYEIARLFHSNVMGASGALYALLVLFTWLWPNEKLQFFLIPYPVSAKFFVPALIILDVVLGITQASFFDMNIAHFAHLGGALSGGLMILLWLNKYIQRR
jgi:membrane associated rhomboid family serine protease